MRESERGRWQRLVVVAGETEGYFVAVVAVIENGRGMAAMESQDGGKKRHFTFFFYGFTRYKEPRVAFWCGGQMCVYHLRWFTYKSSMSTMFAKKCTQLSI